MSDVFIDECGDRMESVLVVADANGGLTVSNTANDIVDRSRDKIIEYLENVKHEIDEIPTDTIVWNGPEQSVQRQKFAKLYKEEVLVVIDKYIKKRKDEL